MGEAARATRPDRDVHGRVLDAGPAGEPRAKSVVTSDGCQEGSGARAYELREGVGAIFAADAQLRTFIDEACAKIREVFGAAGELAISRYQDPEAPDGGPSLYLLIRTTLDAAVAGPLLDRFDEAWWLDNAPRGQGRVEVSLEFV